MLRWKCMLLFATVIIVPIRFWILVLSSCNVICKTQNNTKTNTNINDVFFCNIFQSNFPSRRHNISNLKQLSFFFCISSSRNPVAMMIPIFQTQNNIIQYSKARIKNSLHVILMGIKVKIKLKSTNFRSRFFFFMVCLKINTLSNC